MKYVDEFRDPELAQTLLHRIKGRSRRPIRLMEFCGGHTHAIMRYGLRSLLPPTVELRSGPGCPVCVTGNADLDRAIALAGVPGLILATFGDMIRVPGSSRTLQDAKAGGADVRVVYSALDALQMARQNPDRPVVFLGVGFETTAPTIAAAILQAEAEGLENFSVLSLHKLTPPATRAILEAGEVALDGIIGPGHVTTIIGADAWAFLPAEYGVPVAVAGFEPLDILQAVAELVRMVEAGRPAVSNEYARSVTRGGNQTALAIMDRVFQTGPAAWRGLGTVPGSGLAIRPDFSRFDAARLFEVDPGPTREHRGCLCGSVLRGTVLPTECSLFGRTCTPAHPIGPCMVSAEGACAAYYQFGQDVP
jgi:hydrogenase expression/formation protein HypD